MDTRRVDAEIAWEDLPGLFPSLRDPGRWLPLLRRHAELLEAAAPAVRVTAVGAAAAVGRHYAESLELLRVMSERVEPGVVVDVGSGGGFPGMVLAALLPASAAHLVEPLKKRAQLLTEMAEALGLANVAVHPVRAEEAGRGALRDHADAVTARAVAALPELLEYTGPFARVGGLLVLAKGSGLDAELEVAGPACAELRLAAAGVEPARPVINPLLRFALFAKEGATPERYPRRAGLPGKRPILRTMETI